MIGTRKQFHLFIFCLIVFSQLLAAEKPVIKKEKLQIVFLFGQSNMVGLADARTARYMTQLQYAPPREMAVKKSRYCDCALCDVGGLNNRSLLRILFCRLHRS